MDIVDLLQKFGDPEVIKTLPMMDRMMAGLFTTLLGMGITFVSLVILQIVITWMAKLGTTGKKAEVQTVVTPPAVEVKEDDPVKDEELVAAITTALAIQLNTSASNIVIRNIERIHSISSAWQRAGITEHMNNSL